MSELRRDPIIGRWVVIDPSRNFNKIAVSDSDVYPKDHSGCPFCPGNESMTRPEILAYSSNPKRLPNTPGWNLRVIPNNQPIFAIEGILKKRAEGMYDRMDGIGAHEIIIETAEHEVKTRTPENYETVYKAAMERIKDLRNDTRLEYILFFQNRGAAANAVFEHPHSQLLATPIVPKRIREEINGGKNYFTYKERCVFCDIVSQEISDETRLVAENDLFIAVCPYASRYPFETWIIPKNHGSDFDAVPGKDIISFSKISQTVFSKLGNVLDNPAYNVMIHTGPLKEKDLPYYHWHMEISPRLARPAGFEWGTGLYVNPVAPEEAAKYLRESE